jgi:hypothetical protein
MRTNLHRDRLILLEQKDNQHLYCKAGALRMVFLDIPCFDATSALWESPRLACHHPQTGLVPRKNAEKLAASANLLAHYLIHRQEFES